MKKTHKEHDLTKDVIESLYVEQLLSDREIGDIHGISDVAVSYYRRKYGIGTISARDRISRRACRSGLRDIRSLTRGEFEEMYWQTGESKLAKMFGCSRMLIKTIRGEFGIPVVGKSDRNQATYPSSLTEEQKAVLFGSLLGDGHLAISGVGTSRYKESHCLEQLDYLKWKQAVFFPYSGRIRREDKLLEDGRIAYWHVFHTCSHGVFQPFKEMFYGDGGKRLPVGFEIMLTPMALAVWYMDDGHLSDRCKDGVPTISSGFCREDIDRIKRFMDGRGLDVKVAERDDISIIVIENKGLFFEMIKPHMHPSMMYKVSPSLGGTPCNHQRVMLDASRDVLSVDCDVDTWVDTVFAHLRRAGFSFPYSTAEGVSKAVQSVVGSRLEFDTDIPVGNTAGCAECLSFFKGFWSAKRKGKRSPIEVFDDDSLLRHAIADCIKHRKSVTDSAVRAELATFGGVHNFRPVVAKALIDRYCVSGGRVLDPCAGWGGRLFGFCCSAASEYVGVEVEKETVAGLNRLAAKVGNGKAVKIVNTAFEDYEVGGLFDFIFTSPPYFDAEWYGGDDRQSAFRYKDYGAWKELFLFPLIEKAMRHLSVGGYFALNIANVVDHNIADDVRMYLTAGHGIYKEHRLVASSLFGRGEKWEPIFVCRKSA